VGDFATAQPDALVHAASVLEDLNDREGAATLLLRAVEAAARQGDRLRERIALGRLERHRDAQP
jgi:hypothetical protein